MRILVWGICGYLFLSSIGTIFFVYPEAWPTPVPMTCAEATAAEDLPMAITLSDCQIDESASLVVEERSLFRRDRPGQEIGGFLALV